MQHNNDRVISIALLALGALLLQTPCALAGPFQPRGKTDSGSKDQDTQQAQPPAQTPEQDKPAAPPPRAPASGLQIPLRPNLRMVIRPTILGLVPNPDPEGYGELFARVLAAEGGQVQLFFEVKEFSPREKSGGSWLASLAEQTRLEEEQKQAADAAAAAGLPVPVPALAESPEQADAVLDPEAQRPPGLMDFGYKVEDTRIRRGNLAFSGLDSAPMASPPLFWGDGAWSASGSGIWLSRALLAQLKQSGEAVWQRFEMDTPPDPGTPEAAKLLLVDGGARYPCVVNGARVMLPALYCRDSLGLAEYWIHDDPANPLLLKLSFLPPPGMKPIESIVELDESDQPVEGRDPRLPKLLVKRPGGEERDGQSLPYQPGANQFGSGPRQVPPDIQRAERLDGPSADNGEQEGADDSAETDAGEEEGGSEAGAEDAGADGSAAHAAAAAQGSAADSARRDAGIDTGGAGAAQPGDPLNGYRPPGIEELVACGGGYAIVEIDF
ncbi:hypothetical protein IT575_04795 [bacterium]|nr:hypothetical protein [bacterium]